MCFCFRINSSNRKKVQQWESALHLNTLICLWEDGKKHLYTRTLLLIWMKLYGGQVYQWYILLWSGSETELLQFHSYLNNTNRGVKLSLDFSVSEINFLDRKITKDVNGDLHTSIFRKSTDLNTILRADSFHPPCLIDNIPFGRFQRLKRILWFSRRFCKQCLRHKLEI